MYYSLILILGRLWFRFGLFPELLMKTRHQETHELLRVMLTAKNKVKIEQEGEEKKEEQGAGITKCESEDERETSLIATELWVYFTENIFQNSWVESME